MGHAKETMEDVKEEVEDRASRAFSVLMNGARLAVGLGALVRYLEPRHPLRWLGFGRRRTALGTVALLGAGAVVGAVGAMFLSPMSGEETREGLARSFRKLGRKGGEILKAGAAELSGEAGAERGKEGGGETGAGRGKEGEASARGKEGGGETGIGRGKEAHKETTKGEGAFSGSQSSGNANRGEGSKTYHTP